MTPTAKFRWLDLPYEIGIYAKYPSAIEVRDGRVRVLQQWWENEDYEITVGIKGGWRDIPIEVEK